MAPLLVVLAAAVMQTGVALRSSFGGEVMYQENTSDISDAYQPHQIPGCTCVGESLLSLNRRKRCNCCMLEPSCERNHCMWDTENSWGITLSTHCRSDIPGAAVAAVNELNEFWRGMTQENGD